MKRMVMAALALGAGIAWAEEPVKTKAEQAPLKVLMIGNSCKFVEKDGTWTPKGDVFHMGPDGNYLQALVWTAKLFGADVTKCTYKPGKMPDDRAAFLRQMAMKAVRQ